MSTDLSRGLEVLKVIYRHTKDAPIKGKDVEMLTGVDSREVAEIVSLAVSKGVPVGSSSNGYFRFRDLQERQAFMDREKSRLVSLGRKLSQMKRNTVNEFSLFEQEAI